MYVYIVAQLCALVFKMSFLHFLILAQFFFHICAFVGSERDVCELMKWKLYLSNSG